jgi:hypothetical protein
MNDKQRRIEQVTDRGSMEKEYHLRKKSLEELTHAMSLQVKDKACIADTARKLEPVTREGYFGIAANFNDSVRVISDEHQKKKTDLTRVINDSQDAQNSLATAVSRAHENTNKLGKLDGDLRSAAPVHDYIRNAQHIARDDAQYLQENLARYAAMVSGAEKQAKATTLAFDGIELSFLSEGQREIENAISIQKGGDQSNRVDLKQIKAQMADTTWKKGISPEQIDPKHTALRQPAYDSGTELKKGYINTTPTDYQR